LQAHMAGLARQCLCLVIQLVGEWWQKICCKN
jgi:hypothetical protein